MSFVGMTPDRQPVRTVKKYLAAWQPYREFVESLGFQIVGFDPGFLLALGLVTFELPVPVVKHLMRRAAEQGKAK